MAAAHHPCGTPSINAAILVVGLIFICIVEVSSALKPAALFVFGDSYADTGNRNASDPELYSPWRSPYGNTWPQRPTGRFSDGRIFSDFYASFLGVQRPLAYQQVMKRAPMKHLHVRSYRPTQGVNFAFGGSGVFPTFGPKYPNISAQMGQLQDLMGRGLVSSELVHASTALLVIVGNDYSAYENLHGDAGITEFIPQVVEQIVASMYALRVMGFKSVAATNLPPLGCLPQFTMPSNYTSCNSTVNFLSSIHNGLLASNVSALQAKLPTHFLLLDLSTAFQTAISGGSSPLRPCCEGLEGRRCGDLDAKGKMLYTLCASSNETIFWDDHHPSEAGWNSIAKALFSSLKNKSSMG